jgi:hypothetical protein
MATHINIEEMTLTCHMHEEVVRSGRGSEVLDRVLSSAKNSVPEFLGSALASEPENDSVLFIETLGFDATVNAAWSMDAMGKAVASQLLRKLWSLDDRHVVRFRDRNEVVARFLLHLADGRAYTQTWHDIMFGGLKLLPSTAIVRTLVVDDPPLLLIALSRLSPADLKIVAGVLSNYDATIAVGALVSTMELGACRDPQAIAAALVAQGCFSLTGPLQQFELTIAVHRESDQPADSITLALAMALSQLAAESPDLESGTTLEAIQTLIAESTAAKMYALTVADAAPAVKNLNEESVCAALAILRPHVTAREAVEHYCAFGGIWLVLPHVLQVMAIAAEEHEMSQGAAAQLLSALSLVAGLEASRVWKDGALRDVLELRADDPELIQQLMQETPPGRNDTPAKHAPFARRRSDVNYLRTAADSIGLGAIERRSIMRTAYAAFRAYASRLPGFADASFAHLWRNFLATPTTVVRSLTHIHVQLSPCALDVIWRISGADRARYALPTGYTVEVGVRR